MNIFLPQSVQTRLELEMIADVQLNIITPALSVPIIGIVQDGLLGAYNLTQPTMEIDWKSAMNIISYTSLDDFSAFKKGTDYSGNSVFSLIIPSGVNVSNEKFEVKNGEITKGVLTKTMLGSKRPNSLIHLIWDEYGPEETKKFIDNTQRLINNFNLWNGFTVGIGDIVIPKKIKEELHKLFETKKLEVDHLITDMENNHDLFDADIFELAIYKDLNAIRDNASKLIMDNLPQTNNFNIMITSGSKGDASNMGQMSGCIGQQAVEGKRIQKKLNGRSLAYFPQNDDSAIGRGFVEEPYVLGANPIGFIFHNMASREGLIDTAIKSVTGDTPIVILEKGLSKRVLIGDWIDEQLKVSSKEVKHYKERDMELLDLTDKVYIPTTNELGNVSWGEIKAITRHDPGKELYEIKTHGGRQVIVTESKSLLIWNHSTNKFERMSTPEVKIGDFVPVTLFLSEPPHIKDYINVHDYLPKKEYLYPFSTTTSREHILIPEKFKLNRENGLFVGLFLAEGNADIGNGSIQITNQNENIRKFVKSWFENLSIISFDGTLSQIIGFSTLLSKFLVKLVGNGTSKYVLNDAFNAPEEFIIGLLDGYISGDGSTITKNSIKVSSVSSELITGINMLCSRLGIFGRVTRVIMKKNNIETKDITYVNILSIRGQLARKFAQKIILTEDCKDVQLRAMEYSEKHSFKEQNDVVLDRIISIKTVDVKKYPKVYDLTIPSTLNFGLANGLHVVDTAESGYIQRKLVKAMEDASVKYDNTVRTANNTILQFIYGDNGIDTTKQSFALFKMLEMGNNEIANRIKFTDQEIKNFKNFGHEENNNYYLGVLGLRNILREAKTINALNNITFDIEFMIPVNIRNIITNIKNTDIKSNEKLEPDYILDMIEDILSYNNTKISAMSKAEYQNVDSLKYKDELLAKTVFRFALYEYLSPKILIFNLNLNKAQFDRICEKIITGFNKSVVEPGEMIGVISAQSIGEPTTQIVNLLSE